MKVIGKEIRQMAQEGLYMQMGMFMKEIGSTIKQRVTVYILIWMELDMKGIGKRINNMVWDRNHGLTEHSMKAIILKG
jgi:hypothetical protein